MKTSVFCVMTRYEEVDGLVAALKNAGFENDDVSLVLPDKPGTWDGGTGHAGSGSAAGAGAGAVVGGAVGALAGLGLLTIPGIGPLLAVGPLLSALGGAAVGGALGGLTGGFVGLGVPEEQARQYEGQIKEGKIVLSVHTDDEIEADKAERLLKQYGGQDVMRVNEPAENYKNRSAV